MHLPANGASREMALNNLVKWLQPLAFYSCGKKNNLKWLQVTVEGLQEEIVDHFPPKLVLEMVFSGVTIPRIYWSCWFLDSGNPTLKEATFLSSDFKAIYEEYSRHYTCSAIPSTCHILLLGGWLPKTTLLPYEGRILWEDLLVEGPTDEKKGLRKVRFHLLFLCQRQKTGEVYGHPWGERVFIYRESWRRKLHARKFTKHIPHRAIFGLFVSTGSSETRILHFATDTYI